MDEQQQSTSILELFYLIRAKNKGELSFTECWEDILRWARAVIAEHEARAAREKDECPIGQ